MEIVDSGWATLPTCRSGVRGERLGYLEFCGIDRPVCLYDPEVGDNVYRPLYKVASSKLARKTHVDMLNKVLCGGGA